MVLPSISMCLSSPEGGFIDKEKFLTQLIPARLYDTSQLTELCPNFAETCLCPGLWSLFSSSRTAEVFGQTNLRRQPLYQVK